MHTGAAVSDPLMSDLDDLVRVSCSFERLTSTIKYLINSQKNLTSHITSILKETAKIDKLKLDVGFLMERTKEQIEKQAAADDRITLA